MPELDIHDDYIHEPNERPDYRESYYFNWVDLNSGISGGNERAQPTHRQVNAHHVNRFHPQLVPMGPAS